MGTSLLLGFDGRGTPVSGSGQSFSSQGKAPHSRKRISPCLTRGHRFPRRVSFRQSS